MRANGSCCHTVSPVPASNALTSPCTSCVYSMPSIMIGVDRRYALTRSSGNACLKLSLVAGRRQTMRRFFTVSRLI